MERLVEQAYAAFGEEARRRGIDYEQRLDARPVIVSDGDRRAPDHLQPALERLPLDARRRPRRARARAPTNGTVSVAVDDTGPGIAPEERERIFRRSGRATARGTGSGSRSRSELAVALGGRIELESSRAAAAGSSSCCPPSSHRTESPPARMSVPLAARLVDLPRRRVAARARPSSRCGRGNGRRTCSLFAGIIFAAKLGDRSRWVEALAAFVAYCAASSARLPRQRRARRGTRSRCTRSSGCGRSRAASSSPRLALGLAAVLASPPRARGAPLGPRVGRLFLVGVPRAAGGVHPRR